MNQDYNYQIRSESDNLLIDKQYQDLYNQNRSLITNDISGAQPKLLHKNFNRKLPDQISYAHQEILMQKKLQQQNNINRPKQINRTTPVQSNFGRRRYQYDMMNLPKQIVPQGDIFFEKGGKKHFQEDQIISKQYYIENQNDQSMHKDILQFDRALQTNDIEGAVPGTLISKVVKNKDAAQKYKLIEQMKKYENIINHDEEKYQRFAQSSQGIEVKNDQNDRENFYQQLAKQQQNLLQQQRQAQQNLQQQVQQDQQLQQHQQQNYPYSQQQQKQQQQYQQIQQQNQQQSKPQSQQSQQQQQQQQYDQQQQKQANNQKQMDKELQEQQKIQEQQELQMSQLKQYEKYQEFINQKELNEIKLRQQYEEYIKKLEQQLQQKQIFNENQVNNNNQYSQIPTTNFNQNTFKDLGQSILNDQRKLKLDVINNKIIQVIPQYQFKSQDYEASKQLLFDTLNYQKVPAAKFRARPF